MMGVVNDARDYGERLAAAMPEVIESARWEAKIRSPRDLAIRSGMTHTSLYKRLNGEVTMTVRDLGALGVALGIEPAELLRRAATLVEEAEDVAAHDSEGTIEEEQEAPDHP